MIFLALLIKSSLAFTQVSEPPSQYQCYFWQQGEDVLALQINETTPKQIIPLKDGVHEIIFWKGDWGMSLSYVHSITKDFYVNAKSYADVSLNLKDPHLTATCYPIE